MYMPNASPNTRRPNATYVPLTRVHGKANFRFGVGGKANFSVFFKEFLPFIDFNLGKKTTSHVNAISMFYHSWVNSKPSKYKRGIGLF